MSTARGTAGMSLAEILVVMAITGILFSLGVPRTLNAFEAARVDHAGATLRSIWSAQRMHWLESHAYADSLDRLAAQGLIEPKLGTVTEPFDYRILAADESSFVAQAVRNGTDVYRGALQVDETGDITGGIEDGQGRVFTPVGSD